jgi:hypothetical protein
VEVHGFGWCKEDPKTIGLSSLTANILCTSHNSRLTELDQVGAETFAAIREASRLSLTRDRLKPKYWNIKRTKIDGALLERWFLKTLTNLIHSVPSVHWPDQSSPEHAPPLDWLQVIFGGRQFPRGAGLFSAASVGEEFQSTDTVEFAPLSSQDDVLSGGLFGFRGLKFLLALQPLPESTKLSSWDIRSDWKDARLSHHLERVRWLVGKHTSSSLDFVWRD